MAIILAWAIPPSKEVRWQQAGRSHVDEHAHERLKRFVLSTGSVDDGQSVTGFFALQIRSRYRKVGIGDTFAANHKRIAK